MLFTKATYLSLQLFKFFQSHIFLSGFCFLRILIRSFRVFHLFISGIDVLAVLIPRGNSSYGSLLVRSSRQRSICCLRSRAGIAVVISKDELSSSTTLGNLTSATRATFSVMVPSVVAADVDSFMRVIAAIGVAWRTLFTTLVQPNQRISIYKFEHSLCISCTQYHYLDGRTLLEVTAFTGCFSTTTTRTYRLETSYNTNKVRLNFRGNLES